MAWEEFQIPPNSRLSRHGYGSLNKRGVLTFGRKLEKLARWEKYVILFDKRQTLLGLKPSTLQRAFPVKTVNYRANLKGLRITPVCNEFGISGSYKITAAYIDEGVICLKLERPATNLPPSEQNKKGHET